MARSARGNTRITCLLRTRGASREPDEPDVSSGLGSISEVSLSIHRNLASQLRHATPDMDLRPKVCSTALYNISVENDAFDGPEALFEERRIKRCLRPCFGAFLARGFGGC